MGAMQEHRIVCFTYGVARERIRGEKKVEIDVYHVLSEIADNGHAVSGKIR